MQHDTTATHPLLARVQIPALIVGLLGVGGCALGLLVSREQFFRAWLIGFVFWISVPLGCFAFLMLQHLSGGGWGLVIRRFLETGTRTLPLMLLLFIPLLFGLPDVYVWARPGYHFHGTQTHFKSIWLQPNWFMLRAGIYFAIWIFLSFLLNRWSRQQDRTRNPRLLWKMQFVSGPGLVLYALSVTFASVDWVMSIDPNWFSTIFGMIFMVGQGLFTLAFVIILAAVYHDRPPLSGVISRGHFHDLGNLLMAFTLLWAYVAFSQYLIIWSGNTQEEVPYFVYRTKVTAWKWVSLGLVIFHFAVPFALLLWRRTKRSVRMLAAVAGLLILMRLIDIYWLVIPSYAHARIHGSTLGSLPSASLNWMDLLAPVGIGGLFIAAYIWQLQRLPLVPVHDPRLEEVGQHD